MALLKVFKSFYIGLLDISALVYCRAIHDCYDGVADKKYSIAITAIHASLHRWVEQRKLSDQSI